MGPEDFGGAHMLVNTDADLLIMILPRIVNFGRVSDTDCKRLVVGI